MPVLTGLLDGRHGTHLARPLHKFTPYTVIRDKQVVNIALGTTAGVCVIGSWYLGSPAVLSELLGVVINGPATWAAPTALITPNTIPGSVLARARIHKLTATVAITAPPTGALLPTGNVMIGVLRTPVELGSFATGAATEIWAVNRQELRNPTAYELQIQPQVLHSFPLDKTRYDLFAPYVSLTAGTAGLVMSDSLAPMVVAWPANGVLGQMLQITIHSEWTVMYSSDSVLQATASLHPVAGEPAWEQAIEDVLEFVGAGGAASAFGQGFGRLRAGGRMVAQRGLGIAAGFARALPAIAM